MENTDSNTKTKEPKVQEVNIHKQLLEIQKQVAVAMNNSENPYFGSDYADYNAVMGVSKEPVNEHGCYILHLGTYVNNIYGVDTRIFNEKGESVGCFVPVLYAKQNDPQAQGSSLTYAKRYGLQLLLAIQSKDDDGNKASGKETVNKSNTAKASNTSTKTGSTNNTQQLNTATGTDKKCPKCGNKMILRKSASGNFWGCTGYPNCRHTEK